MLRPCELLQAMDSWLKEYREKLAEAGGMSDRNPHADGKGKTHALSSADTLLCLSWQALADTMHHFKT